MTLFQNLKNHLIPYEISYKMAFSEFRKSVIASFKKPIP